jgi:mannose-6-phosphate isomerase-like protein (cupin superfamily)
MFKFRFIVVLIFMLANTASAQFPDGDPYTPGKDPDINFYMAGWKDSVPRITHGALVEQYILTPGNQLNPPQKGAVLEYIKHFSHTSLDSGKKTSPTKLTGEQEAFYVISGKGTLSGGGKSYSLTSGVAFLVPEGLEFEMKNDGIEPLTMYLVCEPTIPGFKPRKDLYVTSEMDVPFNSFVGHWSYQEKDLLLSNNGFCVLHAVITLTLNPMTIGHPHAHVKGCEEVWTTVSGDNIAWIGKQLFDQPPGTAYMIPPDGKTNHSNINWSKTGQVKMLYFSVRQDITGK